MPRIMNSITPTHRHRFIPGELIIWGTARRQHSAIRSVSFGHAARASTSPHQPKRPSLSRHHVHTPVTRWTSHHLRHIHLSVALSTAQSAILAAGRQVSSRATANHIPRQLPRINRASNLATPPQVSSSNKPSPRRCTTHRHITPNHITTAPRQNFAPAKHNSVAP